MRRNAKVSSEGLSHPSVEVVLSENGRVGPNQWRSDVNVHLRIFPRVAQLILSVWVFACVLGVAEEVSCVLIRRSLRCGIGRYSGRIGVSIVGSWPEHFNAPLILKPMSSCGSPRGGLPFSRSRSRLRTLPSSQEDRTSLDA